MTSSITKTIDINATFDKVFDFLSNPLNWPKWAIVNLKSITEKKDGWYEITTRQGKGQLKMLAMKQYGILDHIWKDEQASWVVPARLIQSDTSSTFIITFFKPPMMDNQTFKISTDEIDIELQTLKKVLE